MAAYAHQKRTVTYRGVSYSVRSNRIEIPDLEGMTPSAAAAWLTRHTYGSARRAAGRGAPGRRVEV